MNNRFVISFVLMLSVSIVMISCNKNEILYRVQKDGLYGFINKDGEMIIEPQYKYVSNFTEEGVAYVINELKIERYTDDVGEIDSCVYINYGYINKENHKINDGNVMRVTMSDMQFWGSDKNLFGQVEKYLNGVLKFECKLLSLLTLNDGLYVFQDENTKCYGYKDIHNNIVIEPKFNKCRRFLNGAAIVKEYADSMNVSVINSKGEKTIDNEYSFINNFMEDGTTWALSVSISGNQWVGDWFYIDKNGNIIAGPVAGPFGNLYGCQRSVRIYNNEMCPIYVLDDYWLGKFYTFINKSGSYLTDFNKDGMLGFSTDEGDEMFRDVRPFSEGVGGLFAEYNGTEGWFFVDSTITPISTAYDSIKPFFDGMAAVKEYSSNFLQLTKWGYVKKNPANDAVVQAIPFKFSECGNFHHGLAYFSNDGYGHNTEGYIDKDGKIVWQTKRKR